MRTFCKTLIALGISVALGQTANAAGDVLTIWEDTNKAVGIELAARDFAKENRVKVVIEQKDSTSHLNEVEKLVENGGDVPDVFIVISDRTEEAVNKNVISDLPFMKADASKYAKLATDVFYINGKYYAAPRSIETLVVYYNKDLLDVPYETIDGYEKAGDRLAAQGKYGLVGKLDELYIAYGMMSAYGAYVFGKNGEEYNKYDVGFASGNADDGLTNLADYVRRYIPKQLQTPEGWGLVDKMFIEGQAAAVINGPWALDSYAKSGINYGIAPLPKLKNGEYFRPFYGVKGYAVAKNSQNKDLAAKFIEFANQPKYALIRYSAIAELPPINDVIANPLIANDDFSNALASQMLNADPMPYIAETSQIWGPMADAIKSVIANKQNAKQALNDAVVKINKAISNTDNNQEDALPNDSE